MEKGFILSLIFAAIIAIFALNNSAKVLVDFVFAEVEMSQAIVILISAIFGAVVAAIFSGVRTIKSKKKVRAIESEIHELREKNKELELDLEAKDYKIKVLSQKITNPSHQQENLLEKKNKNMETFVVDDDLIDENPHKKK